MALVVSQGALVLMGYILGGGGGTKTSIYGFKMRNVLEVDYKCSVCVATLRLFLSSF